MQHNRWEAGKDEIWEEGRQKEAAFFHELREESDALSIATAPTGWALLRKVVCIPLCSWQLFSFTCLSLLFYNHLHRKHVEFLFHSMLDEAVF